MRISLYRVLLPVQWRGRVYGTGERIALTELQADEFLADERIELIAEAVPVNGSRWTQPMQRND